MRRTFTDGSLSQYLAEHDMPLEDPGGEPIDEETPDTYQPEDETMSIQEVAAELPQWKTEPPPSLPPELARRPQTLELTDVAEVRIEHGSFGRLRIWLGYKLLTPELSEAEERSRTLRGVLAETERALPVLRALVENLEVP